MTRVSRIACVVPLTTWVLPTVALAQKPAAAKATATKAAKAAKEEAGYGYRFEDESLLGEGLGTTVPMLKVRQPKGRQQLSRPRTTFVPELVKSVENI
jgi:hypothetical protein